MSGNAKSSCSFCHIFCRIVRGFCARKDSGNMPDRCVVAGCSNTPNAEKEFALNKIPFFGYHQSEAKARRKKWADFVKLKRAKLTATASSAVCSCHFDPEDFAWWHYFGGLKQQRTLIKDEIGILPIPRFQRNMFEEEKLTLRTRRQVSLHACCFGLVSLFNCEMPANWNFITYFATGLPTYYELYFCNSVDFESNACMNTTITRWSFVSCRGVLPPWATASRLTIQVKLNHWFLTNLLGCQAKRRAVWAVQD